MHSKNTTVEPWDSVIESKHLFITNIYNHVNENSNLNDSQLILSAMPIISFSKLALSVIFNNLIENALKYKKTRCFYRYTHSL